MRFVYLQGELNTDLSKYDSHTSANEFLDSLSSIMSLPYTLNSTKVYMIIYILTMHRKKLYVRI